MKTIRRRRPFYQVHLSTLMVQVFVLGFFLYLQLTPTEVLEIESETLEKVELRGWPEVFTITRVERTPRVEEHFVLPQLRNVALAVVVLALLFFLQEAWLRRRKPVFTWVRGVLTVFLLGAVAWGLVKARGEYTMHEYVSVSVTGDPSRADWGALHLYYAGGCMWSDRRWLPVGWLTKLQEDSRGQGYAFVPGEHIHNGWVMPVASTDP